MTYKLKNNKGEYVKEIDTYNEKLILTKNKEEALDYSSRPGGGRWDAENEKIFIEYHFKNEFGDRVTSLKVVEE